MHPLKEGVSYGCTWRNIQFCHLCVTSSYLCEVSFSPQTPTRKNISNSLHFQHRGCLPSIPSLVVLHMTRGAI